MLRKDYIMRQFEEFGKVMAVIFGLKKQNDWEKFEKEIAEASKKFTDIEICHAETLLLPDFEKEVLTSPALLPAQQKMLADLLFEKMNYYFEKGETGKAKDLKNKCLLLYQKFLDDLTQNEFNLDVHYKLEYLKDVGEQ